MLLKNTLPLVRRVFLHKVWYITDNVEN